VYSVHETIDESVRAGKKRDYWLKADRYRLEWDWCHFYAKDLTRPLFKDDWDKIIPLLIKISQKLQTVKIVSMTAGYSVAGRWEVLRKRPILE
jgi:flavin-dependent dehydrogenase